MSERDPLGFRRLAGRTWTTRGPHRRWPSCARPTPATPRCMQ